jgi:aminoglycoside phosphotransferase family enzyme/predicted kinase
MSQSLVQALLSPAAYPHAVEQVELHETHISWVLLAGEFAYKVKKPVNLGFLDFSTLEKRRFFCEEEIRLNGRLAPHLYLGTVTIGPSSEVGLAIDGRPAVEYAVQMKRFPQESLLSQVLERGALTAAHVDSLAQEVAEFHSRIAQAPAESPFGRPEWVIQPVTECFDPAGRGADAVDREALDRLLQWVAEEHARRSPVFEERRRKGFIRECHGDMHLGNMLLEGERITIFDGIEFNDRLRWIDVMSEVAFTAMDLSERGRPDLSARFLNDYLQHTGDYAGLAVLRFYSVYRALVRAKVAAIRLSQPGISAEDQKHQSAERHGYIQLALGLTQVPRPKLLITHGLSGSGKSTGTQGLLERLPAIRIRSDVERKRLAGLNPQDSSRSSFGEGLYAADQTEATYARLRDLAKEILSNGYHAIVDATFLKRQQRDMFRDLANQPGAEFTILDFDAPLAVLRERVSQRQKHATDPSEATLAVLEQQFRTREPLGEDEHRFVQSSPRS